jgi:hypothetical protein
MLSLRRGFLSTASVDRALWLGGQFALLGIALGVAARWLRTRRARALLARDVVELLDRSGPETVAGRLSLLLGDSTLEVAYPVGEPTRFVDALGAPVALGTLDGRATTVLRGLEGAGSIPASSAAAAQSVSSGGRDIETMFLDVRPLRVATGRPPQRSG